jgi:hypothetical protein
MGTIEIDIGIEKSLSQRLCILPELIDPYEACMQVVVRTKAMGCGQLAEPWGMIRLSSF